jgi:glycerol-3-phosphate acyltransferase PlsY
VQGGDASPAVLLGLGFCFYLIGSVPFGLLAAKLFAGTDLRRHGSGNIGATNAARVAGKKIGALVLALDFLKAALPLFWISRQALGAPEFLALLALLSVLGHVFPVWLRFKGGKGVAPFMGACAALDLSLFAAFAGAWLATFALTRVSSLSALVALTGAAVAGAFLLPPYAALLVAFSAAICAARHRENVRRLLQGTEPSFREGGKKHVASGAEED